MEMVAAKVDEEGKVSSVDDLEMNQALVDSEPLEIELDCTNREGLSIEDYMKAIIARHPLLVVSKRSCPFCLGTKRWSRRINFLHVVDDVFRMN